MTYEEFKEFVRQVSKYASHYENDRERYPLFNTGRTLRTSSVGSFEEKGSEVGDCWPVGYGPTCNIKSIERCCIAVKEPRGWLRCHRRRSGRVLTVNLERIAMAKNLKLGVSDEDPHMGICLFHWRLIKYGKAGVVIKDEEIHHWEGGEFQSEKSDSVADDNFVSFDHESSDGEGDSSVGKSAAVFSTASNWRDAETGKLKTLPVDESEEEDEGDSEDDEESFSKFRFFFISGLCALSAASLRRYRKFFMIPTKASASKHAMLEGVEHHFETLPVESNDAIVHFIYTARNRINNVE